MKQKWLNLYFLIYFLHLNFRSCGKLAPLKSYLSPKDLRCVRLRLVENSIAVNILLIIFLFLDLNYLHASNIKPEQELQKKLNNIQQMTASFKQIVSANKQILSETTGTMAIKRPGQLRWQTKIPMEELIIADGKNLWIYDKDLAQVTVKKQDNDLGATAALFLSNYNDNAVANSFKVVLANNSAQTQIYNLTARKKTENFQKISLIFNKNILDKLIMFDQLEQTTTIYLKNIKSNIMITEKLFQFTPPPDVDIIYQ